MTNEHQKATQRQALAEFMAKTPISAMWQSHAARYGLTPPQAQDVVDMLQVWAGGGQVGTKEVTGGQ